mmetsp:Transcript_2236/g.4548  ORF Transcript_2236/g.4548 Transcript_2236/m.4548 type:complete len:121 (+) Transcript_2236:1-363(+)
MALAEPPGGASSKAEEPREALPTAPNAPRPRAKAGGQFIFPQSPGTTPRTSTGWGGGGGIEDLANDDEGEEAKDDANSSGLDGQAGIGNGGSAEAELGGSPPTGERGRALSNVPEGSPKT